MPPNPLGSDAPDLADHEAGALVLAAGFSLAQARRDQSHRDLGPAVEHFTRGLPQVCSLWRLTPVQVITAGSGMPPLLVELQDGSRAVLKLAIPGELDDAVEVMSAAAGRGYARVLAWDAALGALLVEELGADLWRTRPTLADQAPIVAALLLQAWEVSPPHGRRPEHKAAGLLGILDDLGPRFGAAHPHALRWAKELATHLAGTERVEVVCHGDPHPGNVLRRGEEWALIDPDGFLGERAYDLGVVIRDACSQVHAAEHVRRGSGVELVRSASEHLADLTGVEAQRIWQWGAVERVTTGLYLCWFGHADEGARFLDTAELMAQVE